MVSEDSIPTSSKDALILNIWLNKLYIPFRKWKYRLSGCDT